MEDVVNNLNNWQLIKILGGTGIVITGIIAFVSGLTSQWIVGKWQKSNNHILEELKGAISRNNSVVSNLTTQYGQSFQKLLDKRINSVDKYWEGMLKMKASIPAVIHLAYQILRDEELNVQILNNTKSNFGKLISNLDEGKFVMELTAVSGEIVKLRPFLSNELWLLLVAYQGFIGRTVHLIIDGYNRGEITPWRKDDGFRAMVKDVVNQEELKYILGLDFHAYDTMLQLLESKALQEISKLLSTDELTTNSLQQIEKLTSIISQAGTPHVKP